MISYVFLVLSFAFVNCKSFHANQHIPVQQYQPALQYSSPLPAYPQQYIPTFNPILHRQGDPSAPLTSSEIEELQRQYQNWQISLPNQQQGGTVWISAPQYSYYPPPPNYPQYPDQSQVPYPPGPPGALPPQSGQPPQGQLPQSSQPPQQPVNPSFAWSRETSGTTPSNGSSPITNPPSEPSNPFPTQPAEQGTVTIESTSTIAPPIESSTTEFSSTSSESTTFPSSTSESSSSPSSPSSNFTTELPSSTSSNSTELPGNATSSTTPKPSNATSNATSDNPLLKYCTQPRGQFKSEDCGKFVNCWDDVAVEQECPAGLYFNADKQYCDYPQNVDCGNRTTSSPGNNSTNTTTPGGSSNSTSPEGSSNSTNSACPKAYGTYRNTSNCAAFYVCVAGEPVRFDCPPGTNYNDQLKVCDYPYRVDCKGAPSIPIAEESSTSNVTETPPSSESSNSSSSTTPASSSSPASSSTSSSSTTSPTTSEPSTSTIAIPSSEASTTQASSTLPPAPVTTTSEFPQGPPPPPVDPIGYYNFNLKKLPESIVNTGVRCYHANVYRLTPDCSSVTVCQDGSNYIVNCASGTSFDAYSQRCVPTFRARC